MQQRYGKKYNEYQSLRIDDESDHASDPTPTRSTPSVLDIEDFGNILRRNGKALHSIFYSMCVKKIQ
jgi:hypothetical protein